MREAIFQILKEETSLELIMGSYQLLNELDKVRACCILKFKFLYYYYCNLLSYLRWIFL